MHVPRECYQIEHELGPMLPQLRPAQRRTLALWLYGTLLAGSACQHAVSAALLTHGRWHTIRDRLREWLYDGSDRAAPCQTSLEVEGCFAPLLRWILARWEGPDLALAIDVTYRHGALTVLSISLLYRGSAIPVAWHLTRGNEPGSWTPHFCRLLSLLAPVVPSSWRVLVLLDQGLRSHPLWHHLRHLGWHPLVRQQATLTFRPAGHRRRVPATSLVPGPGHAWVGSGIACKHRRYQRAATLVVVWPAATLSPWVLLTDLPPGDVGVAWYSLRMWTELGFRALKGVGWQWQQTRRTDPTRAARHWLVLAVASAWVLAYGTRVEDQLLPPPPGFVVPAEHRRLVSLFRLGCLTVRRQLLRGRLWRRLVFRPEPWPDPAPSLRVRRHHAPG